MLRKKNKVLVIILVLMALFGTILFIVLNFSKFNLESNNDYSFLDEKAEITVNENIIFYNGIISQTNVDSFKKLLDENQNIDTLVIYSEGGETVSAINMAESIFDRGLNVEVETICFSSCANYIFPAGKSKIIRENSIVGWHGNSHQELLFSNLNGKPLKENFKKNLIQDNSGLKLNDKEFENIFQTYLREFEKEKDFYNKINVSLFLALGGVIELISQDQNNPSYGGFTYSIEDMKKFGIKDVSYIGDTYPIKDQQKNKYSQMILTKKYEDINFSIINMNNLILKE